MSTPLDLATWMYDRLPPVTRARDSQQGYPLQQMVAVFAVGVQGLHDDIRGFLDLIDAESCPAALLPELGAMLGFEFPYDMSETQQRAFVKFMVDLYRIKGTPGSLKAVAKRLIGNGFDLDVTSEDVATHTFNYAIVASAGGNLGTELQAKLNYLIASVTPAGLIPVYTFAAFFDENYLAAQRVDNELARSEIEYTSFKLNVATHKINSNLALSSFATSTISLLPEVARLLSYIATSVPFTTTATVLPVSNVDLDDWVITIPGSFTNLTLTITNTAGAVLFTLTYTGSIAGGTTLVIDRLHGTVTTTGGSAADVRVNWTGGLPTLPAGAGLKILLATTAGSPTATIAYPKRTFN